MIYICPLSMSAAAAAGLSASRYSSITLSSRPCSVRMKSMASRPAPKPPEFGVMEWATLFICGRAFAGATANPHKRITGRSTMSLQRCSIGEINLAQGDTVKAVPALDSKVNVPRAR